MEDDIKGLSALYSTCAGSIVSTTECTGMVGAWDSSNSNNSKNDIVPAWQEGEPSEYMNHVEDTKGQCVQ